MNLTTFIVKIIQLSHHADQSNRLLLISQKKEKQQQKVSNGIIKQLILSFL